MHNKQVLIEAIKNLGKAKAPARKKDVVINQRQSPYMQQPSLPTAKEGGENEEKEFVNSQEHGVDTPIYVDLRVGKSKIHGEGVFSNQPVKEGTVVGVSHIRKQFERDGEMYQAPFPSKILGLYNHTEENPNVTEIDNGDYISLIAIRDIQPGEELVSNYYNNNIQDLEKPEDFKNELVRADLGLITKLSKLSKPASTASKYPNIVNTEIGLISKNAPFIGTGNQVIKKGRNISIPETNELLQNIALDLPATALEFPPVYYHGTHSGALKGISNIEGLANLSHLAEHNIIPQSGELITGTLGVNQKGLSTAFASNLDDAVGYSMRDLDSSPISDFKKWWGETRLHYPSESPYFPKPEFYDNLYNTRLEEYNKLTELEKSFIDDKFPMLFGIHPRYGDNSRFWPVSSDIGSETAIGGKVGFDEITNLFVPQSKIGLTQDYLQGRNPFKISPIEPFINRLGFRHSDQQKRFYDKNYSDEIVKSGFGSLLTRPLTLFGKNELTPGDHLYRKIGNSAGLKDLIDKGGAQAPRPFKMKSGMTIDTPFFGVGKTPNENYRGMFAVETALPSKSKYNWSSYAGGTENWGVAPYNEEGYLMKNIPLEDLNVYRKKWFSNNYKKLDPLNLEEGLKYAKTQNLLENLWKWGVLGGLGYSGYQYSKEGEKDEKNLGGSINDRVLRDLDRDLKDPRRSKRFSKSLLATNQLFAPNYLFNKPSPRRIYNPNAKYFRDGGFIEAELSKEEIQKYVDDGYIVEDLPKANLGYISKLIQPAKNTVTGLSNTIKGMTNITPTLANLSKTNLLKSAYPQQMELISNLKNANIISPTLNESVLAGYPNLLNLATKRGIQDALTFSRSTTPSVLEGLSSSGTRTPISNLDMGNFIKYGLVGDDPGLAMYTASHVPGMRYGRRDGLSRLPYKTTYVGNVEQGTPESLDALYTHPQITGIPQNIKEGIFGDTYGSYASILRYPFDYSGSAFDMFDRYKTFENTVFDKGRTLRKYMGAKDAAAGDIGALNFVNKPTSDNIFYQSLFSHASEVPFIGYPGQKVLEPVATYTKPIVQEIKADRENINKLYSEGKYEEVINALNEKVKSGNFGSVESNIKSYEIDPKFPKFDISQYNVPTEGVPTPYTLNAFDPKTGLIPVKGDLESIANTARQAYNSFIEHAVLMDAFRDPTNVVRYPYSPLKYKYKKGGQLPKAELGLITKAPQLPKLLGLKHSANILDDLLVRTSNLWQTPQGISRLNEMIVNTPALSSLNVTPEIMVNDLSNLTNLNYIADDAYEQQKILNEQKLDLRKILREANNAGTSKSDIRSAQRKNLSNLLETENKIKDLEFYYEGMGTQYIEPRYSWQTVQSNPWNHSITIGKDKFTDADIPMVGMHEITHFPGAYYGKLSPGSATYHTYLDDMLSGLDLKSDSELIKQTVNYGTPLKYNMGNLMTGSERIKLKDKFGNVIPGEFEHPLLSAKNYFKNSLDEMSPFLAEVRENMLQDGFIKHPYETMTPTKLKTYYNNYNNIKGNKYPLRYFEIMKPTESNFKLSSDVFNKMLIGLPAVGAAALGSDLDEKAVGGPMLGDPPVVEDPLPITPDSELDDAQKYIRNWFRNRVLPETDDKFYNRIMSKSLDKAKERVNTFPDYTPLVTDDPTARGTYIGGEIPEIQVVPGLSPEEDLTTKVHELTTYVNEPLSDNLQYQDIYGNIIKQNVKSFKEGWGGLTGADKKAAKEFYNYVTDPSEDNIHSYMMNARRIFDVSPDQVVTEADIENWKKTAEDAGMLDKNSENYNDELYILFKLAKDNKSMTNMFNYLAMDESPQMEGDLQRAEQGLVVKALSTLGKVAPEISAASNLVKTAPLINAAVPLVNTTVKFAPEITTADWANWNKATPNYSKLMQEYADIEESTKGMGTWMKNPDGTPYLGSPLQFIQEQSENFKNAFPEGYYKVYRGVQPENSFQDFSYSNKKELMGDRAIFTANRMLANKYARFFKDEQLKSFLDPSDPDNTRGTFSLVYPIGKHMAVDMRDRVWNHLGYMEHGVSNSLPDLESFNNYITNIKDAYGLSKEYRNTDDIAKFLPTSNLNSIILKGLNDSGKGNVHIVNNRPGNYLKSTIGNEGFFNMNSPNIYKSLGGESDYELGDEVDKTTMERLIKEGYTFEEI
jgi:hypothetical protein